MRKPSLQLSLLWTALALVLAARPAHAYLDPASGSMMLQIVLGGLAGLAVGVKLFRHKLRGLFGAGRREADPAPGHPAGPEPPGGV